MTRIEKRNIATCILLSIVTFGIYGIIWDVRIGKEAVSVKDEYDDGLLEVLLLIFLPFLGLYLAEKKFFEGCQMKGYQKEDRSIIYLVLGIFGLSIVGVALMQSDLNNYVTALETGFVPNNSNGGYNANNGYNANGGYNTNSGYNANGGYNANSGYNANNGYNANGGYNTNNAYGANTQNDAVAQLQQLKSLLDQGIITQEEFEQKKAQLLNMM